MTQVKNRQQALQVKNRHIRESRRLISDVKEIAKIKNMDFLVKMDIEKAFDSLDHNFLISTVENMVSVKILFYG